MKKLLSVIFSITMLFTMSTAVFADGIDGPMHPAKIKVGINAEFKPFEYYDENGNLTGFDIDLMNYIGERIGFEIEYVEFPFDRLHLAVTSGEVDCAISAITVTDARKKLVDFSEIYLDTYEQIDETSSQIVNYAIIFPLNSSEKEKLIEASEDKTNVLIYTLVNNAIKELKNDATIEKLLEKYNIPKANYAGAEQQITPNKNYGVPIDPLMSSGILLASPSDWALSDVEKAEALNITENGKIYRYRMSITREEFCEIVYNMLTKSTDKKWSAPTAIPFNDTYNPKVASLYYADIIKGKSEKQFAPNDFLTREEAATILWRLFEKGYIKATLGTTAQWIRFADESQISDWALFNVQNIYKAGIMNGVGENKFAPQDTYTTEQAITTIVRVYEAQSANTGIIGGADTPTEIHIGEDVKVSDFYIEEAFKHTKKAGELAGTKEFISMYIADDETKTIIENLSKTDFEKPAQMYYVSYNIDKVVEYYNKMLSEENPDEEIDIKKFIELNGFNLSVFATQINGRFGATTLAATTVLTSREGYIMPKDFAKDFGIYLQYEGDYSALITFNKIGEGVIEARMQFVRNGEKADMLMFMSEIYDALGEECIAIGKIK